MTLVYLARHGETEWNRQRRLQGHSDVPLNQAGRAQATELAARLAGLGLTRAYASDLGRARETAEIVAGRLGIPFLGGDPRLRERTFGVFEGLTVEECAANHPEIWRRYRESKSNLPPGFEPLDAVVGRMRDAVVELAAAGDGPALVVGHGSAIRLLVAQVTGAAGQPMRNGAVYRLVVDGGIVEAAPLADPPAC
jgi:probable phosphoglycerate mutase